jgi:hypothetical protein
MIGAVFHRWVRVVHDDRAAFRQGPLDNLHLAPLRPAVVPQSVLADQDMGGGVVGPVKGALARAPQADNCPSV